jgi:hypothetical protein
MSMRRTNKPILVPPGGFAGFAQQSGATQALFSQVMGRGSTSRPTTRRKKRTTKKKATRRAAPKRRRTTTKKRGGRLVKGSAAAKRRMAQLRRMRRK